MTRREYIQMTRQEALRAGRPASGAPQRKSSMLSNSLSRPTSAPHNSTQRKVEDSKSFNDSKKSISMHKPHQKAPPAPCWQLRVAKKAEASQHLVRQPRHHAALLGAQQPCGPLPPPLGATMGHGFLSDTSLRDSFFFPDTGRSVE